MWELSFNTQRFWGQAQDATMATPPFHSPGAGRQKQQQSEENLPRMGPL